MSFEDMMSELSADYTQLEERYERLRKAAQELLDGAIFETGHDLIAALRAVLAEE